MSIQLCETCQGQGRETCALNDYKKRVLATARATQADLAATPGPQGGNKELAALFQANTDVDLARLAAEAKERACTVFSA